MPSARISHDQRWRCRQRRRDRSGLMTRAGGVAASLVLCLALSVPTRVAHATVPMPTGTTKTAPSSMRRAAAVGVAFVPGLLLHGAGHFALGEKTTAWRLLALEGVGAAALILGATSLALSGASNRLSVPSIWVATTGGGLFAGAWLADVYGTLAGSHGSGQPVRLQSRWWLSQGYRHVRNPALPGHHASRTRAQVWLGRWSLETDVQVLTDDAQWHLHAALAHRIFGATAGRRASDGSFLDASVGYIHHRLGASGTTEQFGEVSLRARYDLSRLGPTLAGTFMEGAWGVAMGATRYDLYGSEFADLIIAEARFGFYLGHDPRGWSELSGFYRHRDDGVIGGLKIPGPGSGALGHLGATARIALHGSWGLVIEGAVGAARVFDIGVIYRPGGRR
ncbi:MAG: hypothetical protein KC502_20520 [Myxococcales bacterium]|nr:hypothetical protein [Myxococcales bacterium]